MALEISIYNMQPKISGTGKRYLARVCVFTPGQPGRLSEADQLPPFYIRDQRRAKQWVRLEARTISEAKAEAQKAQDIMVATAKGVPVAVAGSEDENRLGAKMTEYLAEVEANKARTTYLAYNRSLELFKESCHRLNVQNVVREDLLAFKTYLRKQAEFSDRSCYNAFLNVMVFFKWTGHSLRIKKNDWPSKPERDPEEYTREEIEALLVIAAGTFRGVPRKKNESRDDRLLLNAYLCSGLRDGEMAHLTYGDIDGKHSLWAVRPKDGHNLKTKESQRMVPVGEWLTKKILEQKKAQGKQSDDLIFPAANGKPDGHLIRILKKIAKKAKLTGRIDQHKFRSTYITTWLRNGCTVPEVMAYVGHVSPSTILRYAANVNLQKKENRDKITQPFDRYATMGD